MIPAFVTLPGAAFEVLPPGIHWSTLDEVRVRFAINPKRAWLFEGIQAVAHALSIAKCSTMYLDGSYTTAKECPSDFDGFWDPTGVVTAKLDPVLLDFKEKRATQKQKYRGEMFIASLTNGVQGTFLEFFQQDKETGLPKGIVGLRLNSKGSQR